MTGSGTMMKTFLTSVCPNRCFMLFKFLNVFCYFFKYYLEFSMYLVFITEAPGHLI